MIHSAIVRRTTTAFVVASALALAGCREVPRRSDGGSDGPGIRLVDARRDRAAPERGDLLAPDLVAPGSDRCAGAAPLALVGGKAQVKGSTVAAANEFGSAIRCGEPSPLVGPQRYHRLAMSQGMTYRIELKPEFAATLYVAASCAQNAINTDCGSGGATGALLRVAAGASGVVFFAPPASGDHRIAVDSAAASDAGGYLLGVEELAAPPHATCTAAKPIALFGGKLNVQDTTLGAKNEFEQQIHCKLPPALAGPQVYYSVDLQAGQWYRITLEPEFAATLWVASAAAGCKPANLEVDCGGRMGTVLPGVPAGGKGGAAFLPLASASYLVAVDSAAADARGSFTLAIENMTPADASTCQTAKVLNLVAGQASAQGDTAAALNDLGAFGSCAGLGAPLVGPQLYFEIVLWKTSYDVVLKPSFPALLAIGQSCSTLPIDCGSAGLTGAALSAAAGKAASLLFAAPKAGSYFFAVDSIASGAAGPFTLEIKEHVPPANGSCASPQPVALAQSPAVVVASTGPLANDLAGVSCGLGIGPWAGPQAYYRLPLQGGKSYGLELAPEPGFDAALYAFPAATACSAAAVNAACKGFAADQVGVGIKEQLAIAPAADEDWIVAVDSWSPSEVGGFSLTVSWQ
jgi:hypothetical protein